MMSSKCKVCGSLNQEVNFFNVRSSHWTDLCVYGAFMCCWIYWNSKIHMNAFKLDQQNIFAHELTSHDAETWQMKTYQSHVLILLMQ